MYAKDGIPQQENGHDCGVFMLLVYTFHTWKLLSVKLSPLGYYN